MLADMERAIENLEIPADGAIIAQALALRSRFDAVLAEAVAAFDATSGWIGDGATSTVAWLRDRGGLTRRSAMRQVSVARQVGELPVTTAAWRDGTLSKGQVEAIVANLSRRTTEIFAAHEGELVPVLAPLSVADTAKAMAQWAARADPDGDTVPEPRRSVHLSPMLGGRWALDGDLDPEGGEVVATALRVAESPDVPGVPQEDRLSPRQRADALVDVCRFFLDHRNGATGGRHRPHLNVVVDAEDLLAGRAGSFVGGSPLDGPSVQRLACDAALHRVVVAGRSTILDYGTATRTIPPPLWNALVLRDEHCRFPGCDRPPQWCEGHHVRFATADGPTALENLVLLCARHHHRLHIDGWSATLAPDGTFTVTRAGGWTRTSDPPFALRLVA